MQNNELEQLRQKRLKWVEANRENGFDEGINRLLTELYPDNAHFIYELLQNAEDPKATAVQFKLTDTSVEFAHNGKRLFTFKDVESITSIGNSTKRDDATSIGKFGIGFKAVFAYTNTPEIHSGKFHFRIHDLVVPETNNIEQFSDQTKQTRFIFPFDNPKKLPELARQEIEKGLRALGDNTLLFLSHIRKIDYTLPDGSQGSLHRIERKDGRIEIRTTHPHSEPTVSHWLHFQKDVQVTDDNGIPITDDDGKPKIRYVAIAYQLEPETGKNKDQSAWKIVPVTGGGQVSIYFPAEKETSKLHFHLHAPFASTVARDSVRDCPANEQLRDHIAELIVESFTVIREQGLLNMSFLAVLPNPKDLISFYPFYEAIRKKIVNAFKNQQLTPTKSGTHRASNALYRGANKISDVISDDDLSILTNYEIPLWAANAPQRNQREDNFLDSLEIDRWDFEQLSAIFKLADKEKITSWLEKKTDAWMMGFYELLQEAKENHDKNQIRLPSLHKTEWQCSSFPLVRVNSAQGDKFVIGKHAHFPPEDKNISPPADVAIVKSSVYIEDENSKKFLTNIGVKPFDEKAVIELRLKRYQSPSLQIDESHYEDIKQFINHWKKNPNDKTIFNTHRFLLAVYLDNKPALHKPSETCLDKPFLETGLAELVEIHDKLPIWQGYSDKLTKNELTDFVEFAKAIGAMHKLEIVGLGKEEAKENPNNPYNDRSDRWNSSTGVAKDYSIPKLKSYLTAKKVSSARLVWNALINESNPVKYAKFKPNNTWEEKLVDSQLIHHLKTHAWIPNKQGEFCTPQSLTRETLHPDFPFNDSNDLLTAVEFGKEEKDRAEALSRQAQQASWMYQSKIKTAKDNGFDSPEEMDEWAKLAQEAKAEGKTPDEFRKQLSSSKKQTELPTESVSNPERRSKKVLENSADAPDKQSVQRERSIQDGITEIKAQAKAYLRSKYQNSDHELICQCCHHEMPFKIKDDHYFEAVQCLKTIEKRHFQNYLALCPTCAAMYQYACETDDKAIYAGIIENNAPVDSPAIEVPVILAGKNYVLRFVGTHWFDLKTILS